MHEEFQGGGGRKQGNPYGRRRGEAPSTEERVARLNQAMPFSDEAEKGVLSCLLQVPAERIEETRGVLQVEAFYHEANRVVYEVLLEFAAKGLPVEPVGLTQTLRDRGLLERVGGAAGMSELFTFAPIPAHYGYYTGIVLEKFYERKLLGVCAEAMDEVHNPTRDESVGDLAARVEERTFGLLAEITKKDGGTESRVVNSAEMTTLWTEAFERIVANRGKVIGIQTGWHDVDRAFHGLAPDEDGDLLMIGGFPGSGKTGCAVSLLESIAVDQGVPTLVFPIEMGRLGVSHRFYLGRAEVDVSISRSGFIAKGDYGPIARASREISEAPIFWDHTASITTSELRAKVQMHVRRHGVRCVIIDHFGQLRPAGKLGLGDRVAGQIEIMECLHDLRRRFGILIILFVQLDKKARERQDKNRPPNNGDVKGASELTEYPTQIGFIHRPDETMKWGMLSEERQREWEQVTASYRTDCPEVWTNPSDVSAPGKPHGLTVGRCDYEEHARFIITKNRWGPTTDEICLRYRKNLQRFTSRATALYSNNPKFRQVKLPGW